MSNGGFYVKTNDGRYLVQRDDYSLQGFSLYSEDRCWPGGFGIATEWTRVAASDVPQSVRERLGFLLEDFDP